ncbi:MAG: F0F1 ATP synthase subunit B [Microbacteriaceae bacterium]
MITRILAASEPAPNPLLPESYDLFWSSVVFVILLTFFWFKVLPNFKKTLDERTEAIEGRLAAAERAQAEVAEKTAEIEKAQESSRAEAAEIREQARAEGVAILAELKEQANQEAVRITATAKAQIEAERQAALVSLRAEVGTLAIDLASQVVGASLKSDKVATGVVDSFLAELEAGEKASKGKGK